MRTSVRSSIVQECRVSRASSVAPPSRQYRRKLMSPSRNWRANRYRTEPVKLRNVSLNQSSAASASE